MSDDKKPLRENLSGLLTILSGVFGIISTIMSVYSNNENKYQATLFLSIGYFAFMVFLISLFTRKKTSSGILVNNTYTERWEYKYSPIYRVFSILGIFVLTGGFTYFIIINFFVSRIFHPASSQPIIIFPTPDTINTSVSGINSGQYFFAREKLHFNPCIIGKPNTNQDEKWELITKGDNGTAYIEALLMTTESMIIDEISLVITQTDVANSLDDMTFYDNPGCQPFGGGPITEINFQRIYIDGTTISYILSSEKSELSATLPYQLDQNEALKVNVPFSPTESGIYHISLIAKIALYSGETQTIESGKFVYNAFVLSENEFRKIQIIESNNP